MRGDNNDFRTNKNICEGFGCSEYAANIIQVSIGKTGDISLNLCDNCVKIFKDPQETRFNKNVLEQQVAQQACSNTFSQNQTSKQQEVLLND